MDRKLNQNCEILGENFKNNQNLNSENSQIIDRFTRSRALFGENFAKLQKAKVLICGCGGVGGAVINSLYRSGVVNLCVIDRDKFEITNQNRQFGSEFLGLNKALAFEKIFPGVRGIESEINENFIANFDFSEFDYIIDAIDDIEAKILLAKKCADKKHYISSMGAAKRLNPLKIEAGSVWKTYNDPFARKFRTELKKQNFKGDFEVIFSTENPQEIAILGSFMGVTASFGNAIAAKIIERILKS